ncbi:P-loop NTPase fold protein [Vibrio splendidus]|uniref:KAP family P-loop NTPase fold protein n=1 Tax=Vibrio sp. 10N.222.49.C9 TaxID=3229615 RepID=UPI00354FF471
MRLSLPELEITKDEGFNPEKDIFRRAKYGQQLTNFILNAEENLVFALDSSWGSGKTTFIKMWHSHNNTHEPRLKTIYFDAFQNDYQSDPFLALASEVYDLFEDGDEESKNDFKEKASNVFKAFSRGVIRTGVKVATAGVIDGSALDSAEKEISTLLSDQVDSVIADKFESSKADKNALNEFKKYLEKVVAEHTINNKLVFVIDELDRCRPDFALEILEKIKHLFSVPGLTFVLVMNREQLQESVKSRYGNGINASLYLQKFINVWLTLPNMKSHGISDHTGIFLNHAALKMNSQLFSGPATVSRLFKTLIKQNSTSFREIERMLTYFAVFENTHALLGDHNDHLAMCCVCYLKVADPLVLRGLLNKKITAEEVHESLGITTDSLDRASQALAYLIEASLCTEGELEIMIKDKKVLTNSYGEVSQNIFREITEILDGFSVG